MHLKTIFPILFLLLLCCKTYSQCFPKSIRASFYSEAVSLPSIQLIQFPIHPAISIGADFWKSKGKHWKNSLGADLTFLNHRLNENALILDALYSLGYDFGYRLHPKLIAGIGYKHAFLPTDAYKVNENGEYANTSDWGFSQFNSKIGLGLEFDLNKKWSITSDYLVMIATPYSKSLPFSLQTLLGVGVKYYLNDLKK